MSGGFLGLCRRRLGHRVGDWIIGSPDSQIIELEDWRIFVELEDFSD
jgi:hypothetical protein